MVLSFNTFNCSRVLSNCDNRVKYYCINHWGQCCVWCIALQGILTLAENISARLLAYPRFTKSNFRGHFCMLFARLNLTRLRTWKDAFRSKSICYQQTKEGDRKIGQVLRFYEFLFLLNYLTSMRPRTETLGLFSAHVMVFYTAEKVYTIDAWMMLRVIYWSWSHDYSWAY